MYTIYLVEDDKNINNLLKNYLENAGYSVHSFFSEHDAIKHMDKLVDLWILDIMLENPLSGINLIKQIRKSSNVPVIFISARDQEYDRILGLELGSDDYISKPFSPREVVLRVGKIINRVYDGNSKEIEYRGYKIKTSSRMVFDEHNELISLTNKEFELLNILIIKINNALSRDWLLEKIWEKDYYGSDRVIDDLVRRLRSKMPNIKIDTIYGYGYRLE